MILVCKTYNIYEINNQQFQSKSTSKVTSSEFSQFSPLQSPQAATHLSPCLRHEQMLLPHGFFVVDLHLQRTKLNKSADAASKSVNIGVSWLFSIVQPHCVGSKKS